MMDSKQKRFIDIFIEKRTVATLATVGTDEPFSATVFYVTRDNRRLYYKSRTASTHAQNLAKNPKAALSIYDHKSDYEKKSGVQLRGVSGRVTSASEMEAVVTMYGRRFGKGAAKKLDVQELISPTVASTMYYFDIQSVKLVSHELDCHMENYEAIGG
jgi:uncharacterized protein YhbP (UPF0306 family)